MTMKRIVRILACVFLPTFLAVLTLFFIDVVGKIIGNEIFDLMVAWKFDQIFSFFIVSTLFGYLFGAPLSILCAIILEYFFARKLSPRSWLAVTLSTGLGLLSGLVLALVMTRTNEVVFFLFWGSIVGFQMGLIIKALDHLLPEAKRQP